MTVRLIGALLLSAGGAGLGWLAGERSRERAAVLDGLHTGIESLRREIAFYQRSIPDALELAASSTGGQASVFFLTCAEQLSEGDGATAEPVWLWNIRQKLPVLSREDREILLPVGGVLGRFDVETQCRALEQCSARLERARQVARDHWQMQKRLDLVLGGAAGTALALLLL